MKILQQLSICKTKIRLLIGEISRGQSPLVKISAHFGRLSPQKLLHWLGFSEFIGLASKVL